MQRMEDYEEKYTFNVEALRGIVDDVTSNPEWSFVLTEHPLNPRFVDDFLGEDNYGRFLDRMKSFAATEDIPFWRLHDEAGLSVSDYHDWAHVNSDAARKKVTQRLVANLQIVLGGRQ